MSKPRIHHLRYDGIGPVVLDDMIPDEWYDVWKEMENIITSTRHITGYWEADVEERGFI